LPPSKAWISFLAILADYCYVPEELLRAFKVVIINTNIEVLGTDNSRFELDLKSQDLKKRDKEFPILCYASNVTQAEAIKFWGKPPIFRPPFFILSLPG
jgi:hypothetical protein